MLLKVILLLSLTAYIVSGDTIDENIEKAKKISKLSKDKKPNGHNDIDDDDLTEGDMKLTKKQKELYYGNRTKRNALKNENFRWTNNVIPYKINNTQFSSGDITKIKKAMKEWQDTTCIRFRQGCRLGETCLSIIRHTGCWSFLGMSFRANQDQPLSLGDGCLWHKTILHELGHAIGFLHEQSRADRDEYVTIHLENVNPNRTRNFKKESLDSISYFGVSYDYFSVMHYGPYYFSANGKKTITTKGGKYDNTIGSVNHLSEKDIKMTRNMYKCGSTTKPPPVTATKPTSTRVSPTATRVPRTTTTQCKNLLSEQFCNSKVLEGKCILSVSKDFMAKYCKNSCNLCQSTEKTVRTFEPTTVKPTSKPSWCYNIWNDRTCDSKVRAGACDSNQYVMLTYCKKSCNFCHRCFDYMDTCKEKIGECGSTFTTRNCRKMCNLCDEPCKDLWGSCMTYAGRCKQNRNLMFKRCPKTCGYC